jgi:hypothetical protein
MKPSPQHDEQFTPWYKERWMLLVIGVPVAAIIWGGFMLSMALSGKDSLVSDSYYKDGMTYTENKIQTAKAKKLNLTSEFTYQDQEIYVTVAGFLEAKPTYLQLQIIHPTLETRDETLTLQPAADGRYIGITTGDHLGKRKLWLESPEQSWMIKDEALLENGKLLQLKP